ncbi:MAG: DUF302 domain-containing protein [Woeseia sp.]
MDTAFGFGKLVDSNFDAAIEQVTKALATEGFGVLSDIDVAGKMKEKLDRDMPPYRILGACNPKLAWDAVHAVPEIGLLLPCNVLVREDDAGKVHVSFMDPEAVMGLVEHDDVRPLSKDVKARLRRVLDAI